ncbi:MAG: hypothetical protein ACYSUV_00080 [Planctomycetota bacterium]|jgi:hypothetical protein
MKKIISLASIALLGILLATSGCVTTGNQLPEDKAAKIEKASLLMKGTVRSALILVIDKNGTNATPYIALARDTLSTFISGSDYSPDALLGSMEGLPSKALGKPEVKLAISTVVSAYEIYYGDYVREQVDGNAVAVKFLTAIRDACDGALKLSP